jgi:chloramphenicol O-acetyltransferase
VQAHHGFVDGYHIHLLAQRIALELADIMRYARDDTGIGSTI